MKFGLVVKTENCFQKRVLLEQKEADHGEPKQPAEPKKAPSRAKSGKGCADQIDTTLSPRKRIYELTYN
jgi:hypothetical protein